MATTVAKPIVMKDNSNATILLHQIGTGETVYKGSVASVSAGGYLVNTATANIATNVAVVIPLETKTATANGVISSDGEGDVNTVAGYISGIVEITTSGLAITDLWAKLYATDNYTFTTTSSGNTLVGTIVQFISSTKVLVDLNK